MFYHSFKLALFSEMMMFYDMTSKQTLYKRGNQLLRCTVRQVVKCLQPPPVCLSITALVMSLYL